ncbi:MAG: hypothetical protein G5663_01800 [Serratia symbiotica]|nr:hypothetical protein [Serratia symbiotica]
MAVDTETHEVIYADLSLSNVTNTEVLSGLIRQTYLKSKYPRRMGLTIGE